MMDILSAIKNRQSERYFKKEKLPRSLVEDILSYAICAPSACNLQLTEYIIVDDEEKLGVLANRVSNKFNWAATFLILITDPRFTAERSAGMVSLGAAMQNILLAAEAFGMGACPFSGFGRDNELKKILNIPDSYNIVLSIALGYPQKAYKKDKSRLPLEKNLYWNEWHGQKNRLNDSLNLSLWGVNDLINYRRRITPTYLYNNRFELQSFPGRVYGAAAELLNEKIPSLSKKRVLDLFSYDSIFARSLLDFVPQSQLTLSDIIDYPLAVFRKSFPQVSSLLISENYQFSSSPSPFDVITCVYKLEFTPQPEKLFKEMGQLLKKDGFLFLAFYQESFKGRLFGKIERLYLQYVKKHKFNVYENNRFYKIGPTKNYPFERINSWAVSNGFSNIETGKFNNKTEGCSGNYKFSWALYRKQ